MPRLYNCTSENESLNAECSHSSDITVLYHTLNVNGNAMSDVLLQIIRVDENAFLLEFIE